MKFLDVIRSHLLFTKSSFDDWDKTHCGILIAELQKLDIFEFGQRKVKYHFGFGRRHQNFSPIAAITTAVTITCRHYGTKYTAKIISASPTGRSLSAEVTPPPPLPSDVRGYALPRRDLICKATHILHQSPSATLLVDPFSDLAEFLNSLSLSLTAAEASEILKSLNNPHLALKFFQFCPSNLPNFRHDPYTYTRMLLILSKWTSPNRFDIVRSIIFDMEESGVRGTISTINILIGLLGHSKDLEMCLGLVKKWDLTMNSYTYKCLLQAYLRSYDSMKAFETYREMRQRGYKLDIFAYNMLVDALVKDEKVSTFSSSFDKLDVFGLSFSLFDS